MSVQRGYYHVATTKFGREISTKPTNFHAPMTAVYTRPHTSSVPRVACTVQPKIMSPMNNQSTQRRKVVSSLSIIPKEKIPKIVVLPSIDKDIVSAKQVSGKIHVATAAVSKPKRAPPRNEKANSHSQGARFVSCLHTSLSTEWRQADSLDKGDTTYKEKPKRTSSLEIQCNYPKKNTTPTAAGNRSSSLEFRVGDKDTSKTAEKDRQGENTSAAVLKSKSKNVEMTVGMNQNNVRVQYAPLRKSFTIKNSAEKSSANFVENRFQEKGSQRLRPRMLPKSRFRVKIQKCHHQSLNISDSFNVNRDKRVKPLAKSSRSVVVQNKSPQRSFSVQSTI